MAALDRIRLTGLLRKDPAPAGSFYFDGGSNGSGVFLFVRRGMAEAVTELRQRRLGQRPLDQREQLVLLMPDVIGEAGAEFMEQPRIGTVGQPFDVATDPDVINQRADD